MKTLKRRRKEKKTDYGKRMEFLKGEKPRIVFRKTNKYIITQYVTSDETKDKTEISANSKQLLNYGWPKELSGSLKSIPASYLTGLLIGKKIISEKKKSPIFDFGMIRNVHKSKIFAFLKGLVDSGVEIKSKPEIFPDDERIKGKHMKKDFSQIFEKIKSEIGKK